MSIWEKILEVACHCPSPHNVQPWLVKITDELAAELYISGKRTLPKEDLTGSFIICAMGMFIRTLELAASNLGYRLIHELDSLPELPGLNETRFFGKLKLINDNSILKPYSNEIILKRHTSRLPNLNKSVPASAFDSLSLIASKYEQTAKFTEDKRLINKVLKRNIEALFYDLNQHEYHSEIAEWFRCSEDEISKFRDGLDYKCMRMPALQLKIIQKAPWLLNLPVLKQIMSLTYRMQLGHCQHLGYIYGDFWQPKEAFNCGKFLIDFWLECTKHEIYIHPFGNLITNLDARADVEKELNCSATWFIFRIGYTKEPVKSLRLNIENIIMKQD